MINTIIIEDDPMVAEINRRYLEKIRGFELITIAPTVHEAIAVIEKQSVDLILLDIYLPGEDGWSLLSKIRGVGKGIDIIIISAACDKLSIKKGMRFGAVDYIIKPFMFERFQSALIKYKEELEFINDQKKISQYDLDQIIYHKEQKNAAALVLPKGLTKNTLNKIWQKIVEIKEEIFSTEDLAHAVGISRVSMRKYLFFLAEEHIIEMELVYGAIGRPVYKYKVIDLNQELIEQYLIN